MFTLPTLFPLAQGDAPSSWDPITIGILIVLLIIILVVIAVLWRFIGLYIRAWISGASVGMFDLIGMSLRKVNPVAIVNARIQAVRAGLDITTPEMESHVLAGGDVILFASSQVPAAEKDVWNPAFDRLMASVQITREEEHDLATDVGGPEGVVVVAALELVDEPGQRRLPLRGRLVSAARTRGSKSQTASGTPNPGVCARAEPEGALVTARPARSHRTGRRPKLGRIPRTWQR